MAARFFPQMAMILSTVWVLTGLGIGLTLSSGMAHAEDGTRQEAPQQETEPTFSEDEVIRIIAKYFDTNDDLKAVIRINQNNIEDILENMEQDAEDVRPIILNYMRAVAANNWVEINNINEAIVQTRDKNKALEFINMLILWISDAFRFSSVGSAEGLINIDVQEIIMKFADHYKNVDYEKIINLLEQSYQDIKSNINVSLTLTNLVVKMNGLLKSN